MKLRSTASLCLLLASHAGAADSQFAVVNSVGLYDTDGSILYSVYLASRVEKLAGVAIGGHVPLGTRFLEVVDQPKGTTFEGVRDNIAAWTVGGLEADQVIGPFTYRVRPDGTTPPWAAAAATAIFLEPEAGTADFAGINTPLARLSSGGSITFDRRGTLDEAGRNVPLPVGSSGILVFVAAGAVEQETTLTFERRKVEEAKLPADADTWWCGLYQITSSRPLASTESISFSLPTRRALPLGLPATVVANSPGNEWQPLSAKSSQRELGFGGTGGFGCIGFGFQVTCGGGGFCQFSCAGSSGGGGGFCNFNCGFGVGVNTAARQSALVSGSQIASLTGINLTAATAISDGTSNITDGTSNTIIAILIGRR